MKLSLLQQLRVRVFASKVWLKVPRRLFRLDDPCLASQPGLLRWDQHRTRNRTHKLSSFEIRTCINCPYGLYGGRNYICKSFIYCKSCGFLSVSFGRKGGPQTPARQQYQFSKHSLQTRRQNIYDSRLFSPPKSVSRDILLFSKINLRPPPHPHTHTHTPTHTHTHTHPHTHTLIINIQPRRHRKKRLFRSTSSSRSSTNCLARFSSRTSPSGVAGVLRWHSSEKNRSNATPWFSCVSGRKKNINNGDRSNKKKQKRQFLAVTHVLPLFLPRKCSSVTKTRQKKIHGSLLFRFAETPPTLGD